MRFPSPLNKGPLAVRRAGRGRGPGLGPIQLQLPYALWWVVWCGAPRSVWASSVSVDRLTDRVGVGRYPEGVSTSAPEAPAVLVDGVTASQQGPPRARLRCSRAHGRGAAVWDFREQPEAGCRFTIAV